MTRGEWWIDDSGHATHADVGDMNHEGVVLEALLTELVEAVSLLDAPWSDLADLFGQHSHDDGVDCTALRTELLDWSDQAQKDGRITAEQSDDVYGFLESLIEWDHEKFATALDTESNTEARLWAAKNWGWMAVRGTDCELWGISKAKLKALADGLYDAYQDDALTAELTITDRETNKVWTDVPFSIIESGSLLKMRQYA